jgi:hypothetical protein
LQIWSVERLHDQQYPLAHTKSHSITTFDPLSAHPPHQLASGRQKGLAPCGTSQVLWQVITLIFKAFEHVVFELLLIIEHCLDIMPLTLFHLGECHRFPSGWPTFGKGL